MQVQEMMSQARDSMTVKRVFGEPYEKNGVAIIPVAKIGGGAGGGQGHQPEGEGSGGGYGMSARPVGAFMLRGDDVTWRPAIDVNKVILGGQIVAIVALLTFRSIVKARNKARTLEQLLQKRKGVGTH
jgi:uncharacterized spore protein YtfJ